MDYFVRPTNENAEVHYSNGELMSDGNIIERNIPDAATLSDLFEYIHTKNLIGPPDFASGGSLYRMPEELGYSTLDTPRTPGIDNTSLSVSGGNWTELIKLYELMNSKTEVQIPETGENVNFSSSYYYGLLSLHDLTNNRRTIDLITSSGTKYTDTLNLCKVNPGFIRLGVEYLMNNKRYSTECMFSTDDAEFRRDINNEISIEYHDKCIRVFPLTQKVNECIISYCLLVNE